MFCSTCGNEMSDAAIMCVKCGVPPAGATVDAPVKRVSIFWQIIGWIGVVFVPIVGLCIGIWVTRTQPVRGCCMILLSAANWAFSAALITADLVTQSGFAV